MKNLTLVIPAKNEKDCLPQVLDELKEFECKKLIVVDKYDVGTIDSIKNKDCEILEQKTSGYGNAIIEGINYVQTPFLCIFNADGSFDPKDLNKMYDLNKNQKDFVFASRYTKNSGTKDDTIVTFIGNKFFSFFGNFFFNLKISDILFTYLMGKSERFKNLKLKSPDFRICVEMPIKINKYGFSYGTIGSYEKKRIGGNKKVNEFYDGMLILIEMIRLLFFKVKKND